MAGKNRTGSAERQIPHTRIEDESTIEKTYSFGRKLGQGSFGKVIEATRTEDGTRWAIKIVNKEKAGSSAVKLLEREVAILKRVNHKHIIHLEEIFETAKRMYLVMELCDAGELQTLFKERSTFTAEETRTLIARLASAISYLHKNDIVHRDIKLENILLSTDPLKPEDKFNIKVTDFGLSVVKGNVNSALQDFCGTPMYMAPEVIMGRSYTQQCDNWSIGVIAFCLISGIPPFHGKDEDSLYENIKKGELDFSAEPWSAVNEAAKDAISGLLKVDPAHRLTAREMTDHPWITGKDFTADERKNVIEMMRLWKDELRLEEEGAINGENNNDPQIKNPDAATHAEDAQTEKEHTEKTSKSPGASSGGKKGASGSKRGSLVGKSSQNTSKTTATNGPHKARSSSAAATSPTKPARPRATATSVGQNSPAGKAPSKTSGGSKPSSPKYSSGTTKPPSTKRKSSGH
ncbi:serine/threonine-protein kinase 33-like isoform X1 [Glandiceps talaboti]